MQGSLRKDFAVAAQNLWDKDPGAWTGGQMICGCSCAWRVAALHCAGQVRFLHRCSLTWASSGWFWATASAGRTAVKQARSPLTQSALLPSPVHLARSDPGSREDQVRSGQRLQHSYMHWPLSSHRSKESQTTFRGDSGQPRMEKRVR